MKLPSLPDVKSLAASRKSGNSIAVKNPVDRGIITRRTLLIVELIAIVVLVLWIITMLL